MTNVSNTYPAIHSGNGTINYNNCCPSPAGDLTTYIRMALAIAFFLCMVLASGFFMLSGSFRDLASAVRHFRSARCDHVESTAGSDCTEGSEEYHEAPPCREIAVPQTLVHDCEHEASGSRPQLPSRGKKAGKLWRKVQKAVLAQDGWAMRATTVAVGCLVGAAPSMQVNLPAPATEGRRSQ
ncbi:hypothetical protein BD309DRAFT_925830 [Dichomitus squalens]|uniref:Uncharacterized protein n=2 Tax=Dichomitus squalens TaxID=114155 RepID=A0A4Q9MBB4_9APHY|nr:uncharacterized protein DICSQDRAFT_147416 [Dichomitus squalens LYAD-421 SS1]EJF60941.1 hypothetical protein DICSQDRAFT_147416 [Dichomitus squalens LYAD-421 SS1]TBU23046.1 hypothetical protein BD311DRAFT_107077 [Dichomitus squalens]TBU41173.1 hypothetical protein BD309DRAFT_925830 [Dichomitus squalens]TBU58048.1 hypothetical protein BD310DRAFT_948959 [Dichomitus squalens]